MSSTKLLIGGAATAALGVRVARSLYGRRHVLPKEDMGAVNTTVAAALVETAQANPEVSENEVRELRTDLRRELERLAGAEIKASRSRRGSASPG
jgi:hypothetical protein